jgi:hypothetical protein
MELVIINFSSHNFRERDLYYDINQLDEFCREKKFVNWFETSAKESTGIDDAMRVLVEKVSVCIIGSNA